MSQENVEVVRQLLGPFEQGDAVPLFRDDTINAALVTASEPFFTPDFECVFVREDVGRATYQGLEGLRSAWLDWLEPWENDHPGVEDVIDAGEDRVVVLTRDRARPQGAAANVDFLGARYGRCATARSAASSSTGTVPRDWRPRAWRCLDRLNESLPRVRAR